MSKPTIILVPGAWHHAHQYGDLTQRLESAGYKVVGIDIPSAVPRDQHPTKGYTDDVEAIQSAIKSEVDQGQKVAVLAHSYGGIPGAQACEGFEDHVTRLVYLSAFAVDVGGSLHKMLGNQWLPWFGDDGDHLRVFDSKNIFYNDVSDDVAQREGEKLLLHSPGAMKQEVTYAGFKQVPSVYIVLDQDKAIPEPVQRQMASQEGKWVMEPITVDAGHIPHLAKPDETVQAVIKAIS